MRTLVGLGTALGFALACGGGGGSEWADVYEGLAPEIVVVDSGESGFSLTYPSEGFEKTKEVDRAIGGVEDQLETEGWIVLVPPPHEVDKGVRSRLMRDDRWLELSWTTGERPVLAVAPIAPPAPAALDAFTPWDVTPVSAALAEPMTCSWNGPRTWHDDGRLTGPGDFEGTWALEGDGLVATGPADHPVPPPSTCASAKVHRVEGELAWLCAGALVPCDRDVALRPQTWVLVRDAGGGPERTRQVAASVSTIFDGDVAPVVVDDESGDATSGVEVVVGPRDHAGEGDDYLRYVLARDFVVDAVETRDAPAEVAPLLVLVGTGLEVR